VFGTLHTNSAPETIDRIIDAYPHEQQAQVRTMLSTSLAAVVTQTLVRKERGPGRVAAHEVMICTNAIRNLIRENKLHQIPSIMQASKNEGMQLMANAVKDLADKGVISRQRAMTVVNNPRLFED
jgi:twitching motility protein PilT